jgi:hypothetical protein
LQEAQWATSQAQADELYRAYEECVRQFEIEPEPGPVCVDDPALGACVEVAYYCERFGLLSSWLSERSQLDLVGQLSQACSASEPANIAACVPRLAFSEYPQSAQEARYIAQEFWLCLSGSSSVCTDHLLSGFSQFDLGQRLLGWELYRGCRASTSSSGRGEPCWEAIRLGLLGGMGLVDVEPWLYAYEGCTGEPLDDCERRLRELPFIPFEAWEQSFEGVADCLAQP